LIKRRIFARACEIGRVDWRASQAKRFVSRITTRREGRTSAVVCGGDEN